MVLNMLAVWVNKFCLHLAKISKDLNFLCTLLLNYREQTAGVWSLLQLLFLNTISVLVYVWQETVNSLLMSQLLHSFHRSWRGGTHSTPFRPSHPALNQGERCKCKILFLAWEDATLTTLIHRISESPPRLQRIKIIYTCVGITARCERKE